MKDSDIKIINIIITIYIIKISVSIASDISLC
jgi:hypothetical protein